MIMVKHVHDYISATAKGKKLSVTENTAFKFISKESTGKEPLRWVLLKSLTTGTKLRSGHTQMTLN